MHKSVATIDSPEFINLQPLDINPLMSKCEIKVLYLGENRNHSFITKDVATEMAKTLRGAPIVGYYKEDKEDFADHGHKVVIDDEGVKFECLTIPYGFVAPDAKVWFQNFEDTDDFGNVVEREYLMTTGFLWTGQFEECQLPVVEGRPQSMELDEKTLEGHWAENTKTGMDFFIINDAVFSKLCILGDDVEPCFEGASVTAPEVSTSFTKIDDTFKNTLYTMMQDLKFALEGGQENMENENKELVEATPVVEEEVVETAPVEETVVVEEVVEETPVVEEENNNEEEVVVEEENPTVEPEVEPIVENSLVEENEEENNDNSEQSTQEEIQENIEPEFSLTDYKELEAKYEALLAEHEELVQFKNQIENEKKDALINSFYMLSDEDKQDVIENKAKYSLEDIEAKLSVICVRKKVSFDINEDEKKDEQPITTFNLNSVETESAPAWVKACMSTQNGKK